MGGTRGSGLGTRDRTGATLRFGRPTRAPEPRVPSPESRSGFKYSHIPSFPPSRPNPDSRYPPNPEAASNRLVQLIHTTPALIFGATSSARLMFSVHTLAASPYGVLLASSTASAGGRDVLAPRTRPHRPPPGAVAAG